MHSYSVICLLIGNGIGCLLLIRIWIESNSVLICTEFCLIRIVVFICLVLWFYSIPLGKNAGVFVRRRIEPVRMKHVLSMSAFHRITSKIYFLLLFAIVSLSKAAILIGSRPAKCFNVSNGMLLWARKIFFHYGQFLRLVFHLKTELF